MSLAALQRAPAPIAHFGALRHSRRAPQPAQALLGGSSNADGPSLTVPLVCSQAGCCPLGPCPAKPEYGFAQPTAEQQMRLAQRVAQAGPTPEARALAAALLALQQRQRQQDEDAAWTLGACAAATGDVWCLLQLALLCAHQAEAAATPRARHQRHRASLAFLRLAGAAVHAAAKDWDCWLRCGASAALGSFVALCSSSAGGPAEAAAQLAEVSRLVTAAAAEEGGAELWALQDLLSRQEARLALERSAAFM